MTVALLVDRPQRTRFRWIALVFVALLALGLALAVIVHRRFVAYRPVAALHVPSGSTFAARFDLTHVMLYEPFRRHVFPLADTGSQGRRERLAARGIELGAEVREAVLALGEDLSDWVLVLGGPLVDREIAAPLASVLREEGRQVDERNGAYWLGGGFGFAQADDGALVFAAREERLRSALGSSAQLAALGHAAGGFEATRRWLPAPLRSVSGTYRAGAVVLVSLSAEVDAGGDQAAARSAMKAVLDAVAALDPVLAEAMRGAAIHVDSRKVLAEVSLSSTAAEHLAERMAGKVAAVASER